MPSLPLDESILHPATFIRHRRQLRAFLLDDQPWFSARDLGRLINHVLEHRICGNLDADQWQHAWIRGSNGEPEQALLVSESAAYAALILYYHPENRAIRQWLSLEVVPTLRSEHRGALAQPRQRRLSVDGLQLSVLHWHGRLWVPFQDLPKVAPPSH
ncbi:hypothetical protein FQZ97_994800 [compost metagenome]